MYYGIQLSVSGILASSYKTDALANNLANANTTAFKPAAVDTMARDPVRLEDGVGHLPSNALLERLGAGVHPAKGRTEFTQGAIQRTGGDLDLAIEGEGFLVLRDSSDQSTDALRLTRDGRLLRGPDGTLVHAQTGLPVLDANGGTIVLPERGPGGAAVTIGADGRLGVGGRTIATLEFVDIPGKDRLQRIGRTLYQPTAQQLNDATPAAGRIRQGALEASAVDPITAMMSVTDAAGAIATNTRMVDFQDRMIDQAINTFGRSA